MENKFEKAVKDGALVDFFLGNGEYFIPDRDYGDHSAILSWNNYIIPYLENNVTKIGTIEEMFLEVLLNEEIDPLEKEKFLTYHLFIYYTFRKENKISKLEKECTIVELAKVFYMNFFRDFGKREEIICALDLIKQRGGPDFIFENLL